MSAANFHDSSLASEFKHKNSSTDGELPMLHHEVIPPTMAGTCADPPTRFDWLTGNMHPLDLCVVDQWQELSICSFSFLHQEAPFRTRLYGRLIPRLTPKRDHEQRVTPAPSTAFTATNKGRLGSQAACVHAQQNVRSPEGGSSWMRKTKKCTQPAGLYSLV